VFRVAFNLRTHGVTLSMDVKTVRSDTPFFSDAGNGWLAPLRAGQSTPPREIVTAARLCSGSSR
ncbi:MAG: hypothetical protein H5U40_01545, partial [Polyangiaceae bacterium]|nr:hypothetical protein [Polyangiaceae bacterium]